MKRKYKPVIRVLALIMAFVCLGVSLAPASFAFAGVLDPGAWLYPIWSIYGASNGVNVTTSGDADFTIDGMTSLWNEYQSDLVSSGLQAAAQSLSDFVNGAQSLVSVVANTVAGSTLGTKLQIGSTVVRTLTSFWNWIIKEKLGGTSVDSVDFDSSSGNIVAGAAYSRQLPVLTSGFGDGLFVGYGNNSTPIILSVQPENGNSNAIAIAALPNWGAYQAWVYIYSLNQLLVNTYNGVSNSTSNLVNMASTPSGDVLYRFSMVVSGLTLPIFEDKTNLDQYAYNILSGSIVENSDSITVAPDAGVDVLGFPDASDQDYVPADAVIPWNIPYDQTKDTLDYIDAAFSDAVTNDLDIGEAGEVVQPVPGVGPVGDYVAPGLGDVFPFCIPFDIYDFLSALAADPVAPSFTAELAFPEAVGGSQYVELDFDTPTFNQLASILRTMELLAFIVGLALLTRSMFIRG